METPSSARRVTRSQTMSGLNNNNIPISRKTEDTEKGLTNSRRRNAKQQQDRSALIDITNDSPIVGLAVGNVETPSSAITKQRSSRVKGTPGSGEALLRGQVKTLLQKVEEEAELSKLSLENRPFLRLQGLVNSPMGLLAPTPANTPQVPDLTGDGIDINHLPLVTPLPVVEEQLKICQVVVSDNFDRLRQESLESQKSLTRSLMLDFSEKFETSDSSSELTYEAVGEVASSECSRVKASTIDDDKASVWSIQANASTHDDDEEEEEEIFEGEEEDEEYYYDECDGDDGGLIDDLCEGISKISVKTTTMAQFTGKHTRFVYNSDDEVVEEEEVCSAKLSPNVLHLKGLPTPKGKHLRFPVEEEKEEEE